MKITKCEGNGLGVCNRCGNVAWMPLLCKIENVPGHYCSNCVRKMKSLLEVEDMDFSNTTPTPSLNSDIDKLIEIFYKMGYCKALIRNLKYYSDKKYIEAYESDLIDQAIAILNKVRLK